MAAQVSGPTLDTGHETHGHADLDAQWDRLADRMNREQSILAQWWTLRTMYLVHAERFANASEALRADTFVERFLKSCGTCQGSRATLYRRLGVAESLVECFEVEGIKETLGTAAANSAPLLRLLAELHDKDADYEAHDVHQMAVRGLGVKEAIKLARDYLAKIQAREEAEAAAREGATPRAKYLLPAAITTPKESFEEFSKRSRFHFVVGQRVEVDGRTLCISSCDGVQGEGYMLRQPQKPKAEKAAPKPPKNENELTLLNSFGVLDAVLAELPEDLRSACKVGPVYCIDGRCCSKCGGTLWWPVDGDHYCTKCTRTRVPKAVADYLERRCTAVNLASPQFARDVLVTSPLAEEGRCGGCGGRPGQSPHVSLQSCATAELQIRWAYGPERQHKAPVGSTWISVGTGIPDFGRKCALRIDAAYAKKSQPPTIEEMKHMLRGTLSDVLHATHGLPRSHF